MRRFRHARSLLLAALCLWLSACVEYTETLTLERDGSGSVAMAIGINEALARAVTVAEHTDYQEAAIVANINKLHGLSVTASETQTDATTRWVRIEFDFDSIAGLNRLDQLDAYQGLFGTVSAAPDADGNPVFRRIVRIPTKRFTGGKLLPAMLAPVLSRYQWRYVLRLPTRIVNTNAGAPDIDADTRTIEWRFSLADLMKEPRRIEAAYAKSGLGVLGVLVAAALMLTCIGAALAWQRRRK